MAKKTNFKSPRNAHVGKLIIALAIVTLILGAISAAYYVNFWEKIPFISQKIQVTRPKADMSRARQMTIDPSKDSVVTIVNREGVRISLQIPKNALKEKTLVKLIPFYKDKNTSNPTSGVIVSPAKLNFAKPVTLAFNFSESQEKNGVDVDVEKDLHITSASQVLQIDSEATTLTPNLIARGLESKNYLPARILTGGAYVFDTTGKHQADYARLALKSNNAHSLIVMESATVLLSKGEALKKSDLAKAKNAIAKILSKKSPPPYELFAALAIDQKLNKKVSLIPQAYAYETGQGYFEAVCKEEGLSASDYLGFAKGAQLMGYDSIGENCIQKAKNLVAEEAKKILANPNSDLKTVILALQDIQIVGLDDDSQLDEALIEQAQKITEKEGAETLDDPNATAIDAAKALQKMEGMGIEDGEVHNALQKKVKDAVNLDQYDNMEAPEDEATSGPDDDPIALPDDYGDGGTFDEEQILSNAVWSVVGVELLKVMGFEELDEASLKKRFDEMADATIELGNAAYTMCVELGGDNCEDIQHELDKVEPARQEGYRVAEDIGEVQSRDYEVPEYTEESGEEYLDGLYVGELTPTPEEDGQYEYEYGGDSSYDATDETYEEYDSSYDSSAEETTDQSYNEENNDNSYEEN